jgi:hypothetical protein
MPILMTSSDRNNRDKKPSSSCSVTVNGVPTSCEQVRCLSNKRGEKITLTKITKKIEKSGYFIPKEKKEDMTWFVLNVKCTSDFSGKGKVQ